MTTPLRKKLIFFVGVHPHENAEAIRRAYLFASTGAKAGLETEVRLAGDAVRVARKGGIPDTPAGERLALMMREATGRGFTVSL